MAEDFSSIEPAHREFILRQHMFFVASAAATGHINLSPKGLDSLRILGSNQVAYLDLTGSGNETAAHLRADGRLTLMFCAFEGAPLILRLYGRGRSLRRGGAEYAEILAAQFGGAEPLGRSPDDLARCHAGPDVLRLCACLPHLYRGSSGPDRLGRSQGRGRPRSLSARP